MTLHIEDQSNCFYKMKCSAVTQALKGQLAIYVNIYSGGALKIRKRAKIRDQYNQVPHLTQNITSVRERISLVLG